VRRVRVLINPNSGIGRSAGALHGVFQQHWDVPGIDLTYQISRSVEDGQEKTRRAMRDGADTILVVGGDGMVNSVGRELVGSDVALGVIPAGSGNGFARHFNIPLHLPSAARALAGAAVERIDVGTADGRPFFVTCSMAWDADVAKHFDRSPVRGILPYVMAAAYGLIEYQPQPLDASIDGRAFRRIGDPLVFTVANLTQYGGGAKIAPSARPDDGFLELVVMHRQDAPRLLAGLPRLFDGTIDQLPEVETHRFRELRVKRDKPSAIQIDGEPIAAGTDVRIGVRPSALRVLVPRRTA
jgi:diacylglycerol kinase family enzyme